MISENEPGRKERKKVKYIVHKLERLLNWLDFADGEITNNGAGVSSSCFFTAFPFCVKTQKQKKKTKKHFKVKLNDDRKCTQCHLSKIGSFFFPKKVKCSVSFCELLTSWNWFFSSWLLKIRNIVRIWWQWETHRSFNNVIPFRFTKSGWI